MPGWILALLILQLNLAPTGVAIGQVVSPTGTPATGVRVYAIPAGDPKALANNPTVFESLALTDEKGYYRLDIPAGRYFIAAGSVDFPTYFPDTTDLTGAKPVLISVGSVVEGINFSRYQSVPIESGSQIRKRVNFFSVFDEAALGRKQADEFERGVTLFNDSATNDYVNRVTQNIVKNSDSIFPVVIKVVKSESATSTVLAGGYIYLTTGMIRSFDNEAELAYVIAQMVGHVASRHVTTNSAKANIMQVALQTGTGNALPQGVLATTMAHFSRNDVNEADFLGLQYLYKSGYDPQAAVTYLKKLEAQEAASPKAATPDPLAVRPPASERLRLVQANVQRVLPSRVSNIVNSDEFVLIKSKLSN